ncbi:hypothetical protein GGR51DRAFT_537126 [Nemania sp. FL0031]|nr:hypothetical protein GGR51DRAFT_537126 [Nemania sp. FL0031]
MDPLSVVGLGANILQFIEFVSKLIATTREVTKSPIGTTVDCADLEAVARNIVQLNNKIIDSINECQHHSSYPGNNETTQGVGSERTLEAWPEPFF